MAKLHPETAEQIASLFNSILVDQMLTANDPKNSAFWMAEEYRKIIELAETFNIFLPTYDLAVKNLNQYPCKNAELK